MIFGPTIVNVITNSSKRKTVKKEGKAYLKVCLRCKENWHPLNECPSEICASCKCIGAVPHKGLKCPLSKFVLSYYLDHGEFPNDNSFLSNQDVPESIFKLCFPHSNHPSTSDPDKQSKSVKFGSNQSSKDKKKGESTVEEGIKSGDPTGASSVPSSKPNPADLPVSGSVGAVHFIAHINGKPTSCVMMPPSVNVTTVIQPVTDSSAVVEEVEDEFHDTFIDTAILMAIHYGRTVPSD
jgi:hypothetical protein